MKINILIRYDIAVDIIRLDMELGKGRKKVISRLAETVF